ncbi:MAG: ATPase [Flavobacterium sp. BFFFF2]|nr:MAG: ATPase [Flavobacterium sp. BFFFF2]
MEDRLLQQPSSLIRIAIVGPRSTGKTLLSQQLAAHFETAFAPEYAHDFLLKKTGKNDAIIEPDDLLPMAYGQILGENEALMTANKYVFCDTNVLAIKLTSERLFSYCDPQLEEAALAHQYDLTFLICPENENNSANNETIGADFCASYKQAFDLYQIPYLLLKGDRFDRFNAAIKHLQEWEKCRELGLSNTDYQQINEKQIQLQQIKAQLAIFKKGIKKVVLERPATVGDGILKLTKSQHQNKADFFDQKKEDLRLKKFVPASGAASRMFQFLSEFINEYLPENESLNAYINRKNDKELPVFLAGIEKFPFYKKIQSAINQQFPDQSDWDQNWRMYHFVRMMMDEAGFNMVQKPKGVLDFHLYPDHVATPIEEHLNECSYYAAAQGASQLHFTVTNSHVSVFEQIVQEVLPQIESKTNTQIQVTYSFQEPSTDTIAVDELNQVFRTDEGRLLFRPGGHGALLTNLNRLNADLIFIKNIDNVIQNQVNETTMYKKSLAGILLELREQVFAILQALDEDRLEPVSLPIVVNFMKQQLQIPISEDFYKYTFAYQLEYIRDRLNRPIRVCGMVKNEGEPGGGPFWIRDERGVQSLQIVESSQIDLHDEEQAACFAASTHFNPVDIVCSIKDYKGSTFDLFRFVDANTGFIVHKNSKGRKLKGYELPGLWNGAMAQWITVFVEVPLITFNPVKTVNDLLKPAHQP